VIVGGLDDALERAVLQAFPGSVVAQSVLEDIDRGRSDVLAAEEDELMFAGWDPVRNQPSVTVPDAEWIDRDQQRAVRTFQLAKRLNEVPDTKADERTPFDEILSNRNDLNPALRTWAASFAVATRLGIPLYSDDRYVRVLARNDNLVTFGTVAALEALRERGRIDEQQWEHSRSTFLASGALGVMTADEMLAAIRGADWRLPEPVRNQMLDPAAWRDPVRAFRSQLHVLRAVFDSAPNEFGAWTARVVDAARVARPTPDLESHAAMLLAIAWAKEDSKFVQALVVALKDLRLTLGTVGDPVARAFDLLLSLGVGKPAPFRAALFGHVIRRLDLPDQFRMIQRVRFGPAPLDNPEQS
jgi:TPR-GreAB-C-PIN type conflict system protein